MKLENQAAFQTVPDTKPEIRLDLVVPFTTPEFTRTALHAANQLGSGLHARIRLLKIQVVPYPLDLNQSPIPISFLEGQLRQICRDALLNGLQVQCEIRQARELLTGLCGTLNEHYIVVLATPKRPWRTRTERLSAALQKAGYRVILTSGVMARSPVSPAALLPVQTQKPSSADRAHCMPFQ